MITDQQNKSWIVCLSTSPPRKCGIATFTADLTNAIDKIFNPSVISKIIAINPTEISRLPYSDKVIFQLSQPDEKNYFDFNKCSFIHRIACLLKY